MKARIKKTADYLKSRGILPKIFFVLGSGIDLSPLLPDFSEISEIPADEIPGFPEPSVAGHSGKIVFGKYIGKLPVAMLFGRKHVYEGSPADAIFVPQVFAKLGAEIAIFTSSTGGIDPLITPGELVLLIDMINLHGTYAASYAGMLERDRRFIPYDSAIISRISDAGAKAGVCLRKGVIASVTGPTYETAAEVGWLRALGASVVSMSMVPEVTASVAVGLRCGGIALVTNRSGTPGKHEEVLAAAHKASQDLVKVAEQFLRML